jgi:hypothetical protein
MSNELYNSLVEFETASGIVAEPKNIGDVMNNLAIRVTQEVLKQIDAEQLMDTGNLRQSVQMPVKFFGTKFVATLFMADYYDYINKGVKGTISQAKAPGSPYSFKNKKPPLFKEWAYRKGLNPFAVQQSVFKKGIRKRPFWDKAYNTITQGDIFELLKRDLATAGRTATTEEIKNIFKRK